MKKAFLLLILALLFFPAELLANWLLPNGQVISRPRRVYIDRTGYGPELFKRQNEMKRLRLGIREVVYKRSELPSKYYNKRETRPTIQGKYAIVLETTSEKHTQAELLTIRLGEVRDWADALLKRTNVRVLYALESGTAPAAAITAERALIRTNAQRIRGELQALDTYAKIATYKIAPDAELRALLGRR